MPAHQSEELRRRLEDHLLRLGCGLRGKGDMFEVYDLDSNAIILTFADLAYFASTNQISASAVETG